MFDVSAHNERIKAIYGNYCFWAWLKYWYIDSANLVQMMLIDKGYYDYDYDGTLKLPPMKPKKTKREINAILRNFGLPVEDEESELQSFIIQEEKKNGSADTSHH